MPVKNLVIVESPGKIKTISKFLGKDYKVMASMGHVRDLPKSKMGVDMENDFAPQYEVSKDKKKVITGLKQALGKDTTVWVATDEDREGEAIGWHLLEALKLNPKKDDVKRIVFHEITKTAIQEAVANPRELDMNKVDAQQARRVLDRLVGYTLSPLLWKKIKFGLSAGRVQSVAVRLIAERERQIMAFVPDEYWSVVGDFTPEKSAEKFEAKLSKKDGKKFVPTSEEETNKVLKDIDGQEYTVKSVEKKQTKRNPAPPFTTSTLQQEAARKLGFGVRKTMIIAQQLYEGVDMDSGHEGLITYMRTDSVSLSKLALGQAQEVIADLYGKEFGLEEPRFYKGGKGAQEAHEAVRPTDLSRTPDSIKKYLDKDQFRLYELIWKRTLACQMAHAILDKVGVDLQVKDYTFRATGQTVKFAGFMKVYLEGRDDDKKDDDKENLLPLLTEGEHPKLKKMTPNQHFTKPPARYTEASLVKKLEAEGIGRPSTYAPTISTVQTRGYVEKEGKQLKPTDIGFVVNDFLVDHFPQIVDYKFTVKMEDMLDEVEEGKETWQKEIKEFYLPFSKLVESKEGSVSREEASQARVLGKDPKSGKPISVRIGRFGPVVQMGDKEDEEKPKFASLPEDKSIHDVQLEDILHLFDLPRTLGETEAGEPIEVNIGRFGPYVKIGKNYTSIKEDDPYSITLERALVLVKEGEEAKKKALIMEFPKEKISVRIGPYGPYIKADKKNVKIPKDKDPQKLTLPEIQEIIANAPAKKSFRRKKK